MKRKFTTTLEDNTIKKLSIFATIRGLKGANEAIELLVDNYITTNELRGVFEDDTVKKDNE